MCELIYTWPTDLLYKLNSNDMSAQFNSIFGATMYRVIWIALLIIILSSLTETSPVVELNQTKAFLAIKTELDDFR